MVRLKKTDCEQVLETNRQLLLEAAAGEFAREGYHGANINRISQAAGFARGTVCLGTASQFTDAAEFYLDPGMAADFALNSLLSGSPAK